MADELPIDAMTEDPHTSNKDSTKDKGKSTKDPNKDLSSTSPESLFLLCDGNLNISSAFVYLNVTMPDLCSINKIIWKQRFRIVATRITETEDRALTSFDQAAFTQLLMLLCACHNEMYHPRSSHRPDIEGLYKRLLRMIGKAELVKEEIDLCEAFIMHDLVSSSSEANSVGIVLPDTPGIDDSDNTSYTSVLTANYYITPFKQLFDHYVTNVRAAVQTLVPLANVPAHFATQFQNRGRQLEGIGRAASGSNQAILDPGLALHGAVPNLANTWECFTFPEIPQCRQWMATITPTRNRVIQAGRFGTGITVEKIFGKGPILETKSSNNALVPVGNMQTEPAAQVAAGPTAVQMDTPWASHSSVFLSTQEIAMGAIYAFNPYYGNGKQEHSHVGDVQALPGQNAVRHLNTAARLPIPAWGGPIMIGPLYARPLTATRADYDRTLVGTMDSVNGA
jgi:hypothetical protein